MSEADLVLENVCQSYAQTVNTGDVIAYSKLFASDTIWMQPGTPIRYGRDEIVTDFGGGLESYSVDIRMTAGDAIQMAEGWIYAISHIDGVLTEKSDGAKSSFKVTVSQLLEMQPSGEWLIKRQMWNNVPAT
jgi:ketosteroid isomerase-like protein